MIDAVWGDEPPDTARGTLEFEHPGQPADLDRVDVPSPWFPGTMPGVRLHDVVVQELAITARVATRLLTGRVDAEPPLACYVTASCR